MMTPASAILRIFTEKGGVRAGHFVILCHEETMFYAGYGNKPDFLSYS
jgi:hypothetical protein